MIIDTHAHINFKKYEGETDEVIKRSLAKDTWVINVGTNFETSKKAIEIAESYDKGVYATIGIHPIHLAEDIKEQDVIGGEEYSFITKKEDFDHKKLKALAESLKKVVGIGETGLDFYRLKKNSKDVHQRIQIETLEKFIQLAKELDLPIILHCRGEEGDQQNAYGPLLDILKSHSGCRGVIHCFVGTLAQAKSFIELGFHIGFTGIVTFKNAKEIQEVAAKIPLEKILIETDAPYLAPEPYRGGLNYPWHVKEVARKIAEIKGIIQSEVEEVTTSNAIKLFNLK